MYYSQNEKLILGINTIWILQPLLDTIIIDKYLYIHTILVIVCSLLFWNNIINYYYDLLTVRYLNIIKLNKTIIIWRRIVMLPKYGLIKAKIIIRKVDLKKT